MSTTIEDKKSEGFAGQLAIILPNSVIQVCRNTPPINTLYLTDFGYYPKAKFHYRERNKGASQHILIHCIDGKGWVEIHGKSRVAVNTGDVFIIPQSVPHHYGADNSSPWSIYWMHFNGDSAQSVGNLIMGSKKSNINSITPDIERERLFYLMYNTLENGYGINNLIYANMTLWRYLVSFSHSQLFTKPDTSHHIDPIQQTISYMQEHLNATLKLSQLSERVNISSSHYATLFKKKTGYAPIAYFNLLKVQKACQYLQFTELRVGEIALKLGFEDQYYFSRLFSNIMESSPVEYRKRVLNKN